MNQTITPGKRDPEARGAIARWLLQMGLEGIDRDSLLSGYCQQLVDHGVPLCRLHATQNALHPHYGGYGFDWHRDTGGSTVHYAYSSTPSENWKASTFYQMMITGDLEYRERLSETDQPSPYPLLNQLKAAGMTDYVARGQLMAPLPDGVALDPQNPPEGALVSWTSDAPGGFCDADIAIFDQTLPQLAMGLKSATHKRISELLMRVYLGRDAGRRVLSGEIRRGSQRQIRAVLCYFDLKEFTSLAEQTAGPDLIEMLNDYFGLAVLAIHDHGGNILKFLGDGVLAMFNYDELSDPVPAALDAVVRMRRDMDAKNVERSAAGLPTTGVTLALHAGEILYGNIGAENRLDFTVIGPVVNQTVRMSGMHRAVGQNVILSDRISAAAGGGRHDLVSLGRYMLRGVPEPQELFTIFEPG